MKKKMSNPMGHSLPIVGGVQAGHSFINAKNHASPGIIASMPMQTNMAQTMARHMSAKRPAVKALMGK